MKRFKDIFRIIILIVIINSESKAQWSYVNPLPDGFSMHCISMIDSSNGWAMGGSSYREMINGTWSVNTIDTAIISFTRVKMLSATDGWALVFPNQIYHYNGIEWQYNYTAPSANLSDIDFINPGNGWAVGDSGLILHYDGANWLQEISPVNKKLLSVHFLNDSIGYIGGEKSNFLKYENGIWSQVSLSPYNIIYDIFDIYAFNQNDIYLGTILGELLHFNGTSWSLIVLTANASFNRIWFADQQHGWALNSAGQIYFYDGNNWALQYYDSSNTGSSITDFSFTSASDGYAVGRYGRLLHWNGLVWVAYDSSITYTPVNDIVVIDTNNIFMSGQNGIFGNIGTGWQKFTPGAMEYTKMDFLDSSHGWAAGQGQFVGYWNGVSWTIQLTPTGGYTLFDVDAVDSNHVWAVGHTIILFWDGLNWTQQLSTAPFGYFIRGVAFTDINNGWACGDGHVWKYQNGNWNTVSGFNTNSIFTDIKFTDANHGWLTERTYNSTLQGFNTIIHYYNGTTWTVNDSFPGANTAIVMHFHDSLNGTLSMGLHRSYYTYHNGVWSLSRINNISNTVDAVYFLDSLNAWAAGTNGVIMRTTTGVTTTMEENEQVFTSSIKCFPNPSRETTIEFAISKESKVRLLVYNVEGKLVSDLINSYYNNGTYSVNFNSAGLPAGLYYIFLDTEYGSEGVKLVVN